MAANGTKGTEVNNWWEGEGVMVGCSKDCAGR